ncbi:hypothetical protein EV363DRAFT_1328779 [Boletus edulis]|nr:hypothetical protein EV363DRAFT_1328779 [Boletus edulis]
MHLSTTFSIAWSCYVAMCCHRVVALDLRPLRTWLLRLTAASLFFSRSSSSTPSRALKNQNQNISSGHSKTMMLMSLSLVCEDPPAAP